MIRAETIQDVKRFVRQWKREGLTIGLVPTMGYLHEGHGSLIAAARRQNDRVIVSDFVNPMQFGPKEDLAAYPRDFERDCSICEEMGADLIFHPSPEEMYFPDFSTRVEMSGLTEGLCGKDRPTHFTGVCTVVSKLFHIAEADRAYFGEKDAQQLAVVRRMARDMNEVTEVIGCPTVRETDGLAKSSRNVNLSAQERTAAAVIPKALAAGRRLLEKGETNVSVIVRTIRDIIEAEPLAVIDYVEITGWDDLSPIETVEGDVLAAVAVKFGKVRLIDNFIYSESPVSMQGRFACLQAKTTMHQRR